MNSGKCIIPKGIIFDFDGVFTDNSVYIDQYGNESVRCSRSDGLGLRMLRQINYKAIVISTEVNPVVSQRCEKLLIDCIQGCDDKLLTATKWAEQQQLSLDEIAFVGNDINDIALMNEVGYKWCVNDAWPELAKCCQHKFNKSGGYGVVREVCEYLVELINKNVD